MPQITKHMEQRTHRIPTGSTLRSLAGPCVHRTQRKDGIFFVFAKGLRAQRAGRVAPRRGGAKRRAAALGAAQRRKAPPQAAERRAAHKACFSAFNFAPIIEKQKMLTGISAGIRPVLWPGQPLGIKLHGQRLKILTLSLKLAYDPRCGPSVYIVSRQSQLVL